MTATRTAGLTVEQVLAEARRRVLPSRDAASQAGDTELAEQIDEFLDDITPAELHLDGVDRSVSHVLAALMGVTLGDL